MLKQPAFPGLRHLIKKQAWREKVLAVGAAVVSHFPRVNRRGAFCVNNDSPFTEALFRTKKRRPGWPSKKYGCSNRCTDLDEFFAHRRSWQYLCSTIGRSTPDTRHGGYAPPLDRASALVFRWGHKARSGGQANTAIGNLPDSCCFKSKSAIVQIQAQPSR